MLAVQIIFWIFLFIIFYAYLGYGIVLTIMVRIARLFRGKFVFQRVVDYPEVTLLIACYNEEDFIAEKLRNCDELLYPEGKLKVLFVTDGSTDRTMEIIQAHGKYTLSHEDGRKGKIAAVNRVMKQVKTPITVFCDANTYLNAEAIQNIVRHFADPRVGCVAGEKRIFKKKNDSASGAGEGIYWKYESYLKRMDSELQNIVGAAGELFAVRTELFEFVPSSTIIEDFVLSLSITEKGYLAKYEPNAYAQESASENIAEELKRKIRICAGGFQAMWILRGLLNPFKHGLLTFQYVSHRVLRWAVVPFLLLAIIPLNIYLVLANGHLLYKLLLLGQIVFYITSLLGWYLKNRKIEVKVLFVPYYFFIMNYAAYMGFFRYIKGSQSAVWERAKRSAV